MHLFFCVLNRCGCSNFEPFPVPSWVPVPVPSPQPFPPCYICDGDPDATIENPNNVIPLNAIPPEFADEISVLPAGFDVTCGVLDSFARGTALIGQGFTPEQCQIVTESKDEVMELYVYNQWEDPSLVFSGSAVISHKSCNLLLCIEQMWLLKLSTTPCASNHGSSGWVSNCGSRDFVSHRNSAYSISNQGSGDWASNCSSSNRVPIWVPD